MLGVEIQFLNNQFTLVVTDFINRLRSWHLLVRPWSRQQLWTTDEGLKDLLKILRIVALLKGGHLASLKSLQPPEGCLS
ncbi:hypothetical protein CHARACLAT_027505 [Characodon lateralis]|uniref:Uncharacterized protein n=1 Tax=Characodon lateralis TaxID=208331 RepID=A0ABU7E412_9TELE|nr:hypothetical protein [Characodon lateralis]